MGYTFLFRNTALGHVSLVAFVVPYYAGMAAPDSRTRRKISIQPAKALSASCVFLLAVSQR